MGQKLSQAQRQRQVVAGLSLHRSADDPDLISARRQLVTERLAVYIAKTVAEAGPLTPAERDRLSVLLKGGDAA